MTRIAVILALLITASPTLAKPAKVLKPNTVITGVQNHTAYRWIDAKTEASGLRVKGADIDAVRAAIRIAGDAHDVVIKDSVLTIHKPTTGSNLPVGLDLRGTVHDVVIEGVSSFGHQMQGTTGYTNGDGFSQERLVTGVTYRRDIARDNSDGGFDLKGKARLDDTLAERNGRNYRFWGDVTASTITSVDPRGAHVWISKTATTIHIDRLVASSKGPTTVLQFDAKNLGIKVTIDSCDFTGLAKGSTLGIGFTGNDVTLGAGCNLPTKK